MHNWNLLWLWNAVRNKRSLGTEVMYYVCVCESLLLISPPFLFLLYCYLVMRVCLCCYVQKHILMPCKALRFKLRWKSGIFGRIFFNLLPFLPFFAISFFLLKKYKMYIKDYKMKKTWQHKKRAEINYFNIKSDEQIQKWSFFLELIGCSRS